MAFFKKKNKDKAAPVTPAEPVAPKPPQPVIPPDTYTLVLGLSMLFFLVAVVVLGLNYYWYNNWTTPPVLPLDWAK
jgi:hypothetical protein